MLLSDHGEYKQKDTKSPLRPLNLPHTAGVRDHRGGRGGSERETDGRGEKRTKKNSGRGDSDQDRKQVQFENKRVLHGCLETLSMCICEYVFVLETQSPGVSLYLSTLSWGSS